MHDLGRKFKHTCCVPAVAMFKWIRTAVALETIKTRNLEGCGVQALEGCGFQALVGCGVQALEGCGGSSPGQDKIKWVCHTGEIHSFPHLKLSSKWLKKKAIGNTQSNMSLNYKFDKYHQMRSAYLAANSLL